MSEGGSLQQRTTYLISLTLVKVEAVEENGGAVRSVSSGASRAEGAGVEPETQTPGGAGETRSRAPAAEVFGRGLEANGAAGEGGEPPSEPKDADAPRTAGEKPPPRRPPVPAQPERARTPTSADPEEIRRAPEAKQSRPPFLTGTPPTETPEPVRTPARTGPPIRPLGQRPASLVKSRGGAAPRGRDAREGRDRSPASAQSLDRKDCRTPARSPGPCRASWAEASGTRAWRDARDEVPAEIGGRASPA
ncbi:classical arabinogalactan protein 9-like [Hippocampus comes]|uniref:classical arabinogalactan protein 9-like n=1 Tax=Hippocampus comes TaxID=109280 RepID=UPI00094E96A4|nr:PREDICTED: classical arabinogalactan protein 9-like [Hippocampus comes]